MISKNVLNNLNQTKDIFKQLIIDSNYSTNNNNISWKNYKSGITDKQFYSKEYEGLLNDRQFSFMLIDNSLFQFYYEFDNDLLTKAKLAYYPYPVHLEVDEYLISEFFDSSSDELLQEQYINLTDFVNGDDEYSRLTNTSHIRIDYDYNVKSHCVCHLQIGGMNEIRIPSKYIFYPFLFFDFIIKNRFKTISDSISKNPNYVTTSAISYKKIFLDSGFNENNIFLTFK